MSCLYADKCYLIQKNGTRDQKGQRVLLGTKIDAENIAIVNAIKLGRLIRIQRENNLTLNVIDDGTHAELMTNYGPGFDRGVKCGLYEVLEMTDKSGDKYKFQKYCVLFCGRTKSN